MPLHSFGDYLILKDALGEDGPSVPPEGGIHAHAYAERANQHFFLQARGFVQLGQYTPRAGATREICVAAAELYGSKREDWGDEMELREIVLNCWRDPVTGIPAPLVGDTITLEYEPGVLFTFMEIQERFPQNHFLKFTSPKHVAQSVR